MPQKKLECLKYALLVEVGAAVTRGSVSLRGWFNVPNGSFWFGKELGNQPKIVVVL